MNAHARGGRSEQRPVSDRTTTPTTEDALAIARNIDADTIEVRGIVTDGYRLFQGIPYAASTVGERRWRPPRPAPAWTQPKDATRPGSMCPQQPSSYAEVASLEEDCLFLNVTAARSATRAVTGTPVSSRNRSASQVMNGVVPRSMRGQPGRERRRPADVGRLGGQGPAAQRAVVERAQGDLDGRERRRHRLLVP